MVEESIKRDPVQVFQEYKARKQAEAELAEYKWSLAEVTELRTKDAAGYAALFNAIMASNKRGDFLYPWQLSRAEAREHLKERGVEGEPWSLAEIQAIMRNPKLEKEYGNEARKAQKEGRIIMGLPKDMQRFFPECKGHFAGESFGETPEGKVFEKNLNAKLEQIDKARESYTLIDETLDKLRTLIEEGHSASIAHQYLFKRLGLIEKKETPTYPLRENPGYEKLKKALELAEADINAEVFRPNIEL